MVAAGAAVALPFASFGLLVRRGAGKLMAAPRRLPGEAGLGPAIDALGGEVVRLRSRDGTRLAARWLPAAPARDGEDEWLADPHEAILLADGKTLAVANGGIETHIETGREKLNLDFMQPSLALVEDM